MSFYKILDFSYTDRYNKTANYLIRYKEKTVMEILSSALSQLGLLGGAAAIIAVLINIFKTLGVIKDGQSPAVSTVANLVVFVGLVATQLFQIDVDVLGLDEQAGRYAVMLSTVFGYFVELGGTKVMHKILAGTPVVGKSFTKEALK